MRIGLAPYTIACYTSDMEKRTAKTINRTIELLKLQRIGIAERSFFGENNHASIDATVRILERALKQDPLDIEEARDAHMDDENLDILAVYDWVLCETDDAPVEEDDPFVKKALLVQKPLPKTKAAKK